MANNSNEQKKYASLSTLQSLVGNIKTLFVNKENFTKANIGLGNVDNTSDANKPVSAAQQLAIDTALNQAKTYTDAQTSSLASTSSVTSAVSTHNTSTFAHNDIRVLITDLTTKLNNFLNVDDATTDQLSEVLQLIENNKGTLESLTTSKVNVSDIIDNLTTNVANKPLSASQGVAIKELIDTLQEELDSHTHNIADVTGLQTALNNKADLSHTHIASDVSGLADVATSGSYNDLSEQVGKSGTGTGSEIFNDYTNNTASGQMSHAEGGSTNKATSVTTITNNETIESAWETNKFSLAKGKYSHVEGKDCLALGNYSHTEGYSTKAIEFGSHAEGSSTTASGQMSHAEGSSTTASGQGSHAEGFRVKASGVYSHAEGENTTASGQSSHVEGYHAIASGNFSHAEGYCTKASSKSQHVQGKYNIEDAASTYAHIIGNGTSETVRSNAHTVDWDGNAWFKGDIYVGGTDMNDTLASRVTTEADHEWTLIYDSGEIPAIANSISGIDISGYTNFEVLVRCYNDGDSHTTRTGSAIFTAQNGKSYQFPVWTNMFTKSISTASVMAQFKLVDGWLVCPYASKLTGDIDIFDTTEGGTAGNLTPTGSGMMKCTSSLSTLTISNLDQNSDYYFGMGSRVMVWGWKA